MRSETPSCFAIGAGRFFRRGFALLMVLGLLGLVTSALVALTALATREAVLQGQQIAHRQARHHAQFALLEALGVLQAQAGQDAAITARAQMLGSGHSGAAPHAQAWTGVWRADAVQTPPVWLVSGGAEPGGALAEENSVAVVAGRHAFQDRDALGGAAEAPAWEAVRVPLVALPGGAYAWWVGDEGVKVNIGVPARNSPPAPALAGQAADAHYWARLLPGPSVNVILPQAQIATVAQAGTGSNTVLGRVLAAALEADDTTDAALRGRILDIADLSHLAEGRPAAAGGYSSDLFHEVTFNTCGVLANPQSGLRADYSLSPQRFALGGEFARTADYEAAMEAPASEQSERSKYVPHTGDLRRRYRMRAGSAALSTGEVSAAIAPVLTDCYMVFNVHKVSQEDIDRLDRADPNRPSQAQRNRIMIHAGILVELWNPYTSALVPQDLLLEVEGLPERVTMHPTGATAIPVALADNLRNGPGNSRSWWIELPFGETEHPGMEPSWLPGRVYNWTGPNNYMREPASIRGLGPSMGNFFHRDLQEGTWAQLTSALYPVPQSGTAPAFQVQVPARTSLTIRLRLKPQRVADWASAPVLAEIRNIEFERMAPVAVSNAEALAYQFGFRVRLEDPGTIGGTGSTAAWNKAQWLRRADPRTTQYAGSALGTGAAAGNLSYYVPSRQPREYVQSSGKGFLGSANNAELWNRPMGESGRLQVEDVPLFELPRHDVLRVADLRHLHLVGLRPYAIGNRWGAQPGNDVNRVFDLGFFSGVSMAEKALPVFGGGSASVAGLPAVGTAALAGGGTLPDERLLPAVPLAHLREAGAHSAAFLLLHGAFNINTTSETAWRAVLAGALFGDFDYIYSDPRTGAFNQREPTRQTRIGRAVARYAQSAAETFDTGDYNSSAYRKAGGLHDADIEPPSAYFRRGLVELSPEHLDLLARFVSRRIGQRADAGLPPFTSFAEFLGPQRLAEFRHPLESGAYMSILEAAVVDAMADTSLPVAQRLNRDTAGNMIWWDAPGFVNGGDLWAQFAHYAAVRSDTFRVRTYGRSEGAAGGLLAEAWCEAVVQRLPQLHGQDAAGEPAEVAARMRDGNTGFGRQFRVVSVRWLRRDEL